MDFKTLVQMRQSCRNFSGRPVERDAIISCLDAARLAPSACNAQPMHYTVCTGDMACRVGECTRSMGMNAFTANVPCFVVISEAPYSASAAVGSRVKDQDYRSVDIGIAAAHLILCAAQQGLASCILGWFDEKQLKALLALRGRVRLVIALGYAAENDPLRKKVRKDFSDLVDFRA